MADVLGALEKGGPATLTQIAGMAGLSVATTLRYLASLEAHGLAERDPATARYRLGIRLFQLGQEAMRDRTPRAVSLPELERLRDLYGETVDLALRSNDRLVLIEALEGTRSISKGATVGDQDPWHSTSLGKAILSALPADEARGILARTGCARLTARTLTDVETLMRHLEDVRARGYSVDDEESEDGLRCVGAAVLDAAGCATYAVSVSGPAQRMTLDRIDEMGAQVRQAADAISAGLGYRQGPADEVAVAS